jgi:hypothetical protein
MKIKAMVMVFIIGMALGQVQAMAEQFTTDAVFLGPDVITMPQGRILLISRNGFVGAINFIENEERSDGWYSKYEYYQYEKSVGFGKFKEGYISFKKMVWNWWNKLLYHYLQFHPNPYDGVDRLVFDKFELIATPGKTHSSVYFWSKANVVDEKARLAPTPWKEIQEVDLNDKRIEWFKYDETRKGRIIQIDRLW